MIVVISANLTNFDIDTDKAILGHIDIDQGFLQNIDNKEILENIKIDKILNPLEFGISNRATIFFFADRVGGGGGGGGIWDSGRVGLIQNRKNRMPGEVLPAVVRTPSNLQPRSLKAQ